jgi:hypothetical protein
MPCSHCKGAGHNFKGCPTMSQEEKIKKCKENKEKKESIALRRRQIQERYQQALELEKKRKEEEAKIMKNYEVINKTNNELAMYWGFHDKKLFKHFSYLDARGSRSIRVNQKIHSIYIFHALEIMNPTTNEVPKNLVIDNNFNYTAVFKMNMKDFDGNIIIIDKEFVPKKNELDQWKESSLKANFLLEQIIKMGGNKYENIAPMLDMVEDIIIPQHSDYDREFAGVPSKLTNIT